ncbi:MAG: autotransporter assembly complex family protein, partial [Alphaproteobacteria bacterium]
MEVTRTDGGEETLLSSDPLLETVRGASELVTLVDRVPLTLSILNNRIESDRERLVNVLRAEGYYDGTVEIRVTGLPPEAARPARPATSEPSPDAPRITDEGAAVAPPPAQVTIAITPGQQYTLRTYAIENAHPYGSPFPVPIDLADIDVALGDPATGRRIVRAQDQLITVLGNRGRPFAEVIDRLVIADHAAQAVDVTLTVDAGPTATFGPIDIHGLEDVDAELIRDRITWMPGEPYDQAKVNAVRTALAGLEVFSSISIGPAEDWTLPDGSLPMRITVSERAHRTIGGSVDYSSTDGPGARLYWRHRNLFGQAERLEVRLAGSRRLSELAAEYRDNTLFDDIRYNFTAEASVRAQETPSFTSRAAEVASGVSYALDDEMTLSLGARVKYAVFLLEEEEREADGDDEQRVLLFGLPLAWDYDLRNDRFNPSSGALTRVTLEPLLITPDPVQPALRATIYQTGYWAPFDDDSLVIAGWGQVGGVFGADRDAIPADERFYVGGGGSVRGFAYQFAGDIDENGDPLGGQSMVSLGAEARFRFLDDYGAVVFVEGGRAFAES